MTVVAGPNGSGKSNVIDGLRWATGGGRASEFRAGEKTELIFHGSRAKRGLGYAEVEVELETPSGPVTVQRTLQRDGTGRLRLNGRNARFMDIDEALAGTGLGRSSLAIISQGEISSVLMADPGRLLNYVTEAAGVARLANRRELAQSRLSTALDHLERLQDLHGELSRQVERLGEEARDAASHSSLSREELVLRFSLAHARRKGLEDEIRSLADSELELTDTIREQQSALATLEDEIGARRRDLDALQEEYRQATARVEAWRGDQRLLHSRAAAARARGDELAARARRLDSEVQLLLAESEPEQPEGDDTELKQALDVADSRLEAARSAEASARTALLEAGKRQEALQEAARAADAALVRKAERIESLEARLSDVQGRIRDDGESEDLAAAEAHAERLASEHAAAEATLAGLRTRLEAAQHEHATATAQLEAQEAAAARLRSAVSARRGFAQGPRAALSAGLPGVHGAVADLLGAEDRLAAAVSAALGRRAEYVVAETAETAREVIEFVRQDGGFVTVLPLDLLSASEPHLPARISSEPGVHGLLIGMISFEPEYRTLFRQLLGSTVLVESLDEAVAIARKHRDRPRMVTLTGETLESGGSMSGGRSGGQTTALGLARDLADAEEAASETTARTELARKSLLELQERTRAALEATRAAAAAAAEAAARLARSRESKAAFQSLHNDLRQQRERLTQELAEANETAVPPGIPEADLSSAANERAARLQESEARAAELEQAASAAAAARQAHAVFLERFARHREAKERFEADQRRLGERRVEREQLAREVEAVETERAGLVQELAAHAASEPGSLDELRKRVEDGGLELRAAEERVRSARREAGDQAEAVERIRLTAARRETMLQTTAEELQAFPAGLEPLAQGERSMRSRLSEVTAAIARLGPVNHRAAAELETERLRAHQLAADLLDAQQATQELEASLELVDREATERTEAAITSMRAGFAEHVAILFGGDASSDIDVEREDGRPVGLIIRLRPPGKHTTQLNLLSVGERTMGALAFLFSLMHGEDGGLPVAVLDEVDAPLDEANITRFTGFVERLAEHGTQFLLISHQKTTFSVADTMWGVTSDGGVSSVFSIRRDDSPGELTSAQVQT